MRGENAPGESWRYNYSDDENMHLMWYLQFNDTRRERKYQSSIHIFFMCIKRWFGLIGQILVELRCNVATLFRYWSHLVLGNALDQDL